MLRKIVTIVVVVPLAIIIIAFAIANRQTVTVSFDPFSAVNPAYAARLPLFALIFALVILGVIVGGVTTWFRQASWRRSARALEGEVRTLHQELEALRRRVDAEAPSDGLHRPSARTFSSLPPPGR